MWHVPSLADVTSLLDAWYPPDTAEAWDAVGLVYGDPAAPVAKVLLAVDAALPVAQEAAAWGADLLLVHHPLFFSAVHGFAPVTPKGRTLWALAQAGCGLFTAHTNADQAVGGVSESLALVLGLTDLAPLVAGPGTPDPHVGHGRIGSVPTTTLRDFAATVAAALPRTGAGIRVAGELDRPVRRVALCGGAGGSFLEDVAVTDADVYVTSDLSHHTAGEFLERGGAALVDVPHWAAEWTWLPVAAKRLREAWGDSVEVRVSEIVTDPWSLHLGAS